jgi:hypothetical protein
MFSSKICSVLNSDSDQLQLARERFLENLTDSISNYDLLNSEITSTTVINALDQLKKGKSYGLPRVGACAARGKAIVRRLSSVVHTKIDI